MSNREQVIYGVDPTGKIVPIAVDVSGNIGSGGGGGASATDIGNAVNGTSITGQSLEAGGAGTTGWLASLRKAVTDRLPASLGAKTGATSLSVVPASDGFLITNTGIGVPAECARIRGGGHIQHCQLIEALVS